MLWFPTELYLSNLDFRVSDSDIQQLFSRIGILKSSALHHNRTGSSLGTAVVEFERGADAWKAIKLYNAAPLYGKPLRIQILTSQIPEIGRHSSGGGGPVWRNINRGGAKRNKVKVGSRVIKRHGGARRAGRYKIPVITVAQLDAELDDYFIGA